MATAKASEVAKQPPDRGKVMSWLSKVFALNPQGINWARAVFFLDVALVPYVVLVAIGEQQYFLSAVFAVLFTGVSDPGGSFGYRASRLAVFGLAGAAVTALGFGIATSGWGWLVLAVFVVTLVSGLALKFGVHRFIAIELLNIWFIIALVLGSDLHIAHVTSHTWAQALAWVGGTALWIAVTFIGWLIRGRKDQPQPVAELPGGTSQTKLTPPVIAYAVLRALGMAGATAVAFGADLSHADWTPIAAIVAMRPSLTQTTVFAAQRLAGALIGAAAAVLLMLIAAGETGTRLASIKTALALVTIMFLLHGVAIRFWNYAFYCAAIAAGVLIAVDLPNPGNYSAEGDRVLYTLIGVAIAVIVMLLGNLLAQRTAKARPQAAPHPA